MRRNGGVLRHRPHPGAGGLGDRRVHGLLWAVGVYPVRHRDAPEERRIPPAVTTHLDLGGRNLQPVFIPLYNKEEDN